MKEHFLNYDTKLEARRVARNLNKLAKDGNICMNCNLYRYFSGPALQTETMTAEQVATMGGVYREKLPKIKIESIPLWIGMRGIWHIVLSTDHRWTNTACGSLMSGGEISKLLPQRICSRCRERISDLVEITTKCVATFSKSTN